MTINPKPDVINSASEQVMVRQSLNSARTKVNQAEEPSTAQSRQEPESVATARASADTLDFSPLADTSAQPVAPKEEITSLSGAEEALESVSKSILNDPEQAMQAQASALPKSVMDLIQ